jgi:hypothetical protein
MLYNSLFLFLFDDTPVERVQKLRGLNMGFIETLVDLMVVERPSIEPGIREEIVLSAHY